MATNSIKLLTGNSYPQLAQLVADRYVPPNPDDLKHSLACWLCVDSAAFVLEERIENSTGGPQIFATVLISASRT